MFLLLGKPVFSWDLSSEQEPRRQKREEGKAGGARVKRSWERPGPRGWQDRAGEGRWGWTLARAWLPLWDKVGIVLLPSMGKWPAFCLQPLKHQLLQALHTWILLGAVLTWLVWPLASDQKNKTSPTAHFQGGRGSVGLVSSRLRSEGSGGYLTLQIRPVNCLGSEYMVSLIWERRVSP